MSKEKDLNEREERFFDKMKAKARAFGLANWGELSHSSHSIWDHVFGKETRLRPAFKETSPWIKKAIAIAEDSHAGFDDASAGTL